MSLSLRKEKYTSAKKLIEKIAPTCSKNNVDFRNTGGRARVRREIELSVRRWIGSGEPSFQRKDGSSQC